MAWLERAFLQEFIELYESFPELWNIKSDIYHNKIKKQKAYEQLLQKLKQIEPEATVDVLKRKINILRTNYRRELKKIKYSERSGAGTDEIYVSSLWYFDDLYFLNNQETQKDGVSSEDLEAEVAIYEDPKPPTKKLKLSINKQQLLARAVESLEKSAKPVDEATVLSASWETLYRNLDSTQKLFANKVITETLYQGALGNLNGCTHKAVEAQCTTQSRPQSTSTNYYTSTPLPSPDQFSSRPYTIIESQPSSSQQCTRQPLTVRPQSTSTNYSSSTPLPSPDQFSSRPYTIIESQPSSSQQCTRQPLSVRPQSTSTNYSSSTPLPSPDQFSSSPYSFIESQPEPIIHYSLVPQTSSVIQKNNIQEFFNEFDYE